MNLYATLPILIVAAAGTIAMGIGLLPGRRAGRHGPAAVAMVGIAAALIACAALWGDRVEAFDGSLHVDRFALLLNAIILVAALAVILLAERESAVVDRRGEFAALILLSAAGMMLVAGAGDLIVLFVGIELLSVALYVLAALEVWRERSLEAGLKYLVVGAVGSAILLYGLALLYGATGQHQPGGDLRGPRRQRPRRRAAGAGRRGADRRGAGLQGLGGTVPHVDARRLRGRADAGHGLHVHRHEGGGHRGVPADLHRRALPHGGRLGPDHRPGRRGRDHRRQRRRAGCRPA